MLLVEIFIPIDKLPPGLAAALRGNPERLGMATVETATWRRCDAPPVLGLVLLANAHYAFLDYEF